MTLAQAIEKIRLLPKEQRKAIFLIVMTIISLLAVILAINITDRGLNKSSLKVNLPALSKSTQENQLEYELNNDVMTGVNNNIPAVDSTDNSSNSGFNPNEVFNFNQ